MVAFPFDFAVPFARLWKCDQNWKEGPWASCVTSAISSMRFTASSKPDISVIRGMRVGSPADIRREYCVSESSHQESDPLREVV